MTNTNGPHASEATALLDKNQGGQQVGDSVIKNQTKDGMEDGEVALLIYRMFNFSHSDHLHPKTIPKLCPETRGKRHRHPYVYMMNQFRHWWKTSRLLVRLCGSYEWCYDATRWALMGILKVAKHSQAKQAFKQMKHIGRGGPNSDFLTNVHPFTRTLRLVIAICRALEARVDNRFFEVGIAEAMAFMGNRCFRYWSRHLTDVTTLHIMFPLSAKYIEHHLQQHSRPVIVMMGLIRAILPFAMSFMGSAFGRKLTFNTMREYNYRWHPVQNIFHFHEHSGTYQDIEPDPQLFSLARQVAVAIGHGHDAAVVRENLARAVGFELISGAGSGGYCKYHRPSGNQSVVLHVTPYGPSVLDEMPRYLILERRPARVKNMNVLLNAAVPSEAILTGYTYSGAFFTSQEWASLQNRFEREMECYRNACKIMGTNRSHIDSTKLEHNELVFPPTDLDSLKAFIATGKTRRKQRKSDKKWKHTQKEVKNMARIVQQHKKSGTAPHGVILYMEGLDCSGKSSTGGLIQDALEESGYHVEMRQYNRPPTDEQKRMSWMSRFERPNLEDVNHYEAMVWDRGPAGDFVYGNMAKLPEDEKIQRFAEFRAIDRECQDQGILFFKLLFVTDKDSIAATLGKRLAHKKIARDLTTWLDANSAGGKSYHEGLSCIEAHIDPTDFIAFNKFSENLGNFCDVARNTEHNGYDNPWFVVNTSDRYSARLSLMKAFEGQIEKFSKQHVVAPTLLWKDDEAPPIPKDIVEAHEHGISMRAILQTFFLLCLAFAYAHQTWKFGF